jgi:hypothetical protein
MQGLSSINHRSEIVTAGHSTSAWKYAWIIQI